MKCQAFMPNHEEFRCGARADTNVFQRGKLYAKTCRHHAVSIAGTEPEITFTPMRKKKS